ncbi:MAG TPA: ArsB/NhaD family transporter [Synergistales bacterium]|nr:ArsB/NhaD family transporter [Synergistales bacterium]
MSVQATAASAVFVLTIIAIATGRMRRSVAALLGASLLMAFNIIPAHRAVAYIDFNTIGLLMGMMIIVGVISRTGLFQYIAVMTVKATGGRPHLTFISVLTVTALLSAFLDNVTTVLLVSPVVISLVDLMDVNPIPFLIGEAFASNIGGTATLVGDPPNIIIGSFANFSFMDFIFNLTPAAILVLAVVTAWLTYHFRKDLAGGEKAAERIAQVDESRLIKDKHLMVRASAAMILVVAGFGVHHLLDLPASVIALLGAALLLAAVPVNGDEIIHRDIEWPTILFFASLFIIVGALNDTGVIAATSGLFVSLFGGRPILAAIAVLWFSGLVCAFVNNVAFSATFVYVVRDMATATGLDPGPLFWALALGACLGGNGTFLGAAANVIVADIAEKSGNRIHFRTFMRTGLKVVVISLTTASLYVVVRWGGLF